MDAATGMSAIGDAVQSPLIGQKLRGMAAKGGGRGNRVPDKARGPLDSEQQALVDMPGASHIHINGEHVPVPPGYQPPAGSTVIR